MNSPSAVVASHWYVYTNPPTESLKGHILPKFLSRSRRLFSVEVHRLQSASGSSYEECLVRILDPANKEQKKLTMLKSTEKSKDEIVVYNPVQNGETDNGIDDLSVLGIQDHNLTMPDYPGWKTKFLLSLKAMTIVKVHKNCLSCILKFRKITQNRLIFFDSDEEALDCVNFIDAQRLMEEQRLNQKFSLHTSGLDIAPTDNFSFLVEIVGATNLRVSDIKSSDPYVLCYFNHELHHRTKYISSNLDPIWTIKTGSLFLLKVTAKDLFQGDGMDFDVMDFDTIGSDERLGHAHLDPSTLFHCDGKRIQLQLDGNDATGSLAVRVRRATKSDEMFMENKVLNSSNRDVASEEEMRIIHAESKKKFTIETMMNGNTKVERFGMGPPVKKYRIRPGPDPKRVEETTWMTMEQMEQEVLAESRQWIDAGSGDLGRVFVEVLSCSNLPNLDVGGFAGNYTDAFACLIYEDIWAQTDIIHDDLNPMWMPWTKRAFIFHMYHPSSQLFIGVFDHDLEGHDLIGRVAVNLSNLQPDTLYTLTYDLYFSGKFKARENRGKITIRLRIEIENEQKLLVSTVQPPKTIYVNVKNRKDFKVLHSACDGGRDMVSYSKDTLDSYVHELQSYTGCDVYIKEAIKTVLLWRGQSPLVLFGMKVLLPLNSFLLFLGSIVVVEYPQMLPSFFFMSIAWLLHSTMNFRRNHPNPWRRCKSFSEMCMALAFGNGFPPTRIEANQDSLSILEYEKMWQEKMDLNLKKALQAKKEAEEAAKQAQLEAQQIGDTQIDITTKKSNAIVSVDIWKPFLEPIQGYLFIICQILRHVRNVILWEECYLSFWVTLCSIFLSVASLLVPWFFVIRWTSRIFVWTLFGPWMKLVDIYYWSPMENMSQEEISKLKAAAKKMKEKYLAKRIEEARINRENAIKLKDMKQFLFGKFIMEVPVLKDDRWVDYPLSESSATPFRPQELTFAEVTMREAGRHCVRVQGQNLEGDMIPHSEVPSLTEAPTGQPTKRHAQPESDSGAYAKVGSLVASAAVITYVVIPLISRIFEG